MLEESNIEIGHTAPFRIHLSLVDPGCDFSVAQYWFILKFPTSYFEKTWDGVPKILPAVKDDVLSPESSHDSTTPEVTCDRSTMHEFFEMLPESELISEPTSTAFEN